MFAARRACPHARMRAGFFSHREGIISSNALFVL
jgi:hypothetical protein